MLALAAPVPIGALAEGAEPVAEETRPPVESGTVELGYDGAVLTTTGAEELPAAGAEGTTTGAETETTGADETTGAAEVA
jgi:hypothetical protein